MLLLAPCLPSECIQAACVGLPAPVSSCSFCCLSVLQLSLLHPSTPSAKHHNRYAGPSATVTLLASGGLRVQPGLVRPPPADISDPRWGAYRLRGAACGIPILAYDCVCQEAVEAAEGVIGCMLEGAPAEVAAALEEAAAEVAIIGRDQVSMALLEEGRVCVLMLRLWIGCLYAFGRR